MSGLLLHLWPRPLQGRPGCGRRHGHALAALALLFLATGPRADALNTGYDGQTDILWHSKSDASNYSWLLNGITWVTAVRLPSSWPTNWDLVGTGDFDRDSQTDLLFRDALTGQMAVWFMTNSVIKLATPMPGLFGNTNYYVVGTGDFNNDGILDILWHHQIADETVVWFMNSNGPTNYTFGAVGWCPLGNDSSWRASTTGDFNNDGNTDIVWRHLGNGQNSVWLMKGTNRIASVMLSSQPDLNFRIVAAGHFNRESNTDLLWRHQVSGVNGVWLMGGTDGTTLLGEYLSPNLLPVQPDPNWIIGGVGGYTNTMGLAASIDATAGTIRLNWNPGLTRRAAIERKRPADLVWTTLADNYAPYTITDTGRSIGQRYEYRVDSNYILTAINDPPIERRGQVIMVVDNSITNSLVTELADFKASLVGDGWTVVRTNVPRHDDVTYTNNWTTMTNLKAFIVSHYNPGVTNVVLLIGHVPIPYAGSIPSDGHYSFFDRFGNPQRGHDGAWPADAYYGNTNDVAWTDSSVNLTNLFFPRATNVPHDRKFDNEVLPTNDAGIGLQLAVGRIDFADLPAFAPKTETDLLRQYFKKNRLYRTGQIALEDRATVAGFFSAGAIYQHPNDLIFYAARANATRWFGIAPGKLVHADVYDQTSTNYLWGFHAGNGDPQGQQGDRGFFHLTVGLADPNKEPRIGFYMILGSWLADWNLTSDNILRATLATPNYGLAAIGLSTNAFMPFQMQNLGLGEPLANAMLQTCAALGKTAPRWLTIMGDPTLRLKMPATVSGFTATAANLNVDLSWNSLPSAGSYYLYRSTTGMDGPWTRLTTTTATHHVDTGAPAGALYMMRGAILTTSGCGSYTNLTQGVFAP